MTMRRLLGLVLGACVVTTTVAASPPPVANQITPFAGVSDTAFTSAAFASGGDRVELASGVIEPNRPGCNDPLGRNVVSNWGTLSYADMGGATAPTDVVLPSPTGDLAYQLYGDPQMVRLKNGDLAYLRVVALFTPITPKPSWFDYNNSYWRGGLAIWQSHCGNDWKLASLLDVNKVFGGKCAQPQGSPTGHWFGGFDRPQMYTDPIDGTVYVSTYCTGGTAPIFTPDQAFDNAMVLRWHPDTGTWDDSGQQMAHEAPNPTTTAGRLFLFRCGGWPSGPPLLFSSGNGGTAFDSGTNLSGGDAAVTCQNSPRGLTDQLGYYSNAADFGVARLGNNSVRVLYPSMISGRQGLRVDDVTYSGGEFPNGLTVRDPIMSEWPDGSIGHFTYIEEDSSFPTAAATTDGHSALLAWTEYSPSKKAHRERALLFHGPTQMGKVFTLSGADWSITDKKRWNGDYEYGTFGYWDGACHFMVPWNATDKGGETMYIHDAVVTDKSCAKGASTTPVPPPTVTPTLSLVTAKPLTPFAVKSISLNISTCTRTGTAPNPWVCPLTGHFVLTPGIGGTLTWQVKPTVVFHDSCGETYDYLAAAQPQPAHAVALNQSSIDIAGQLVFPDSEIPASNLAVGGVKSLAHAFSGSIQSSDVPFVSDANCKP